MATPDTVERLSLVADAHALTQGQSALLAEAHQLAAMVTFGEHGRRRAGAGDEFWQYRTAQPGDDARRVDWRRSSRSDETYLRQQEWQAAQSITLWVDTARSMDYTGQSTRPTKAHRAKVIALALGILALKGGERVGLAGHPPRPGRSQITALAQGLFVPANDDYGQSLTLGLRPHGRILLISDFMGPLDHVEKTMAEALDVNAKGMLLQVLDPFEESFPFAGRTLFQSIGGSYQHETQDADGIKAAYLDRFMAQRARLTDLCRQQGWRFDHHRTDQSAALAVMAARQALSGNIR